MMRDDALAEEEVVSVDSPDYPSPSPSPSHRVANAVVHVDPLGSSGRPPPPPPLPLWLPCMSITPTRAPLGY